MRAGMKPLGHSRGLDGVRGIAIIGVVGRHFFSLPGGSLGGDLFFVLSGFLITTLLLEERDRLRTIRLSVFYARRARRLLPALGVLLLLVALVGSLAYSPGRLVLLIGAAAFYFLNLLGVSGHRWVYAGTPEKYTPACQEFADGQGRTELIVRWQPFVMRIAIGRPNKDWGGDPERALKMSRDLAQRLSVQEAEGEG